MSEFFGQGCRFQSAQGFLQETVKLVLCNCCNVPSAALLSLFGGLRQQAQRFAARSSPLLQALMRLSKIIASYMPKAYICLLHVQGV